MNRNIIAVLILFMATWTFAQTQTVDEEHENVLKEVSQDSVEGWKTGGMVNVTFSQVALANWGAGGESSISTNGILNLFANLKSGKNIWENSLDIGYGVIKQEDSDWQKSDDKIDFMTKYGRQAYSSWYYSALFNFKTQMMPGYDYSVDSVKISEFLAPGYITAGIGMDYKPTDYFNVFISPATTKLTIVRSNTLSNEGAFGVDPGEHLNAEFGAYLRMLYQKDLLTNVNFLTKLDLFTNYLDFPEDSDTHKSIDVNWETLISLQVNKYIVATLGTNLIYDKDVVIMEDKNGDGIQEEADSQVQFKEVLSVGLTYKF